MYEPFSQRLGTALRNLVSDMSKKGVTLGGKKPGSLTANKISNYDRLHKYIEPIYTRLTDVQLLKRCELHSTQNANESLHNSIWARCSKAKFHSKERVGFAAVVSISEFNFGTQYVETQSNILGTTFGDNLRRLSTSKHRKRLLRMKDITTGKDKIRKQKRKQATQKALEEFLKEHGHLGYEAGQF